MAIQPPPPGIGFVWSEGVRLIDGQLKDAAAYDSKSAPLFGLSTATLAIVFAQREALREFTGLIVLAILVVLTILVFSFRVRRFAIAPTLPALVPLANLAQDELQLRFIGNLLEAYVANQAALTQKAFFLKWSIYSMLASALLVGLLFVATRI